MPTNGQFLQSRWIATVVSSRHDIYNAEILKINDHLGQNKTVLYEQSVLSASCLHLCCAPAYSSTRHTQQDCVFVVLSNSANVKQMVRLHED
jgi:hypothetical protein